MKKRLLLPLLLCFLCACGEAENSPESTPGALPTEEPWEEESVQEFSYGDTLVLSNDTEIDLSQEEKDIPALLALLQECGSVETVELGTWELDIGEAESLRECCPGTFFRYDTDFFGQRVSTDSRELDISGTKLTDTAELECALVRFPKLEKLILCDCGLDDETLEGLNERYAPTRFVWTVQVYNRAIRTDQDYFILYNAPVKYPVSNGSCLNLRYCHDLVAADLGHLFVREEELEFLYGTPHLKYLVLVDGLFSDITPIGSLGELEYLEIFSTPVRDLSPLLQCKNLRHLNISRCIRLGEDCIEVLKELPQLERLWFIGHYLKDEYEQELMLALPETEIHYCRYHGGHAPYSMDYGWRKHESYYAMRDALHMFYMDDQV